MSRKIRGNSKGVEIAEFPYIVVRIHQTQQVFDFAECLNLFGSSTNSARLPNFAQFKQIQFWGQNIRVFAEFAAFAEFPEFFVQIRLMPQCHAGLIFWIFATNSSHTAYSKGVRFSEFLTFLGKFGKFRKFS